MKPPDVGPFALDRFEWDGRVFILNAPIECVCTRLLGAQEQKDLWCYVYEPTNLRGYNHDRQEAWDDFNEALAFDWDEYAQEDDSKLHSSGIQLKNKLLAMVKIVDSLPPAPLT